MARIAIIGLGLIGGSLGLALKQANRPGLETIGFDIDPDVTSRARRLGAVDLEAGDLPSAVENAAVVVIATPIIHVLRVMEEMAPALLPDAIVTDTASTKRKVLRWATDHLPAGVSFVGGHPIAGKEQDGLDAAEAGLFQGRPWAVTPSLGASEQAIRTVEGLITLTGARPMVIDAEEHDSYLAGMSHLPLVVATALFALPSQSLAWPELASLAGPGFRDTTRLASTNPDLSHDICMTNRENVVHWVDRYIEELRRLRTIIADEAQRDELYKAFVRAQVERDAFLEKPPERPQGEQQDVKLPGASELLMGDFLARRMKDIEESITRVEDQGGGRRREGR
jgi:prephenate dehydrogenase